MLCLYFTDSLCNYYLLYFAFYLGEHICLLITVIIINFSILNKLNHKYISFVSYLCYIIHYILFLLQIIATFGIKYFVIFFRTIAL